MELWQKHHGPSSRPRAIDTAANKGDHKPAKDLLMHTGVIQPLGEAGAQGAVVLVGVNIYQDMATGQRFHGEPPPNCPVVICMTPGLAEEYRSAGLPQPFQPPSQEVIDAEVAMELPTRNLNRQKQYQMTPPGLRAATISLMHTLPLADKIAIDGEEEFARTET